jgi:hypothetical protein
MTGCPETALRNYYYPLRNDPGERISMSSCRFLVLLCVFLVDIWRTTTEYVTYLGLFSLSLS